MISVERVLEYSKLDTEENLESDTPPPPSWPQNGKIVAKNARLRYGPNLPWVFHGLNFVINGREKVRYCSTLNYMSLIFDNKRFWRQKKGEKNWMRATLQLVLWKWRSCCTDVPTTIMFKNNILVCQNYDTKSRAIDSDSLSISNENFVHKPVSICNWYQ